MSTDHVWKYITFFSTIRIWKLSNNQNIGTLFNVHEKLSFELGLTST